MSIVRESLGLAVELAELRDQRSALLDIHRPRKVSGGQVRCTECATFVNDALRRTAWPCPTAVALGVTT